MADTLTLEIITPEKAAYSAPVEMVILPGVEGELGILPRHIPLVTEIKSGDLVITKDGKQEYLAVGEGFVEVTGDRCVVLTSMALEESEIDEDAAAKAIERAQKAMEEKLTDEDQAAYQAELLRSMAMLNLKRRRRGAKA
ncbi:MAG: ATP synthase F1 subunit epsilon [Verrucomicrobiales bacterium]